MKNQNEAARSMQQDAFILNAHLNDGVWVDEKRDTVVKKVFRADDKGQYHALITLSSGEIYTTTQPISIEQRGDYLRKGDHVVNGQNISVVRSLWFQQAGDQWVKYVSWDPA
ncbi:hypothetical protein PkoCFBP13504_30385 [Pseudomonas koreensis]|uniref:Uncharacterized protein n=1 Tax=Pseudomonas chlororaphis TaxID=587753 RepID=A0A0A6DGY4_9PSED|nr:hypothetical protein [Pseudomonas koreensis]KHA73962.1 hypothetical protein NZ35_07615 [Pseudomonas chlororaphis]TKJ69875.1 hypothetical protein PkoCFBP13504_30385 [Pseudomonas koreensis]